MRYFTDPESGYLVPVPACIDVVTGEIVQRFEPRSSEILMEGQVVKRSDYPKLFEILSKSEIVSQQDGDSFVLPDLRGRLITRSET